MSHARILTYILVGAVSVRLLALAVSAYIVGTDAFVSGDAIGYVKLAESLLAGNGFVTRDTLQPVVEVFRTPGFPILLAPFTALPHGFLVYGILMSIVVGVVLPLSVYGIARRFVSNAAALTASALIAFEPHAVFYSFLLQTEMPSIVCAVAGLYAAIIAYDRSSYRWAAGAGALLGYAAFIRPGNMPLFVVLIVGTIVWLAWVKDARVRQIIVVLCIMGAIVAPWYIRNHSITGVYALSGAGWRNVYTDYLASVRSLENDTFFHDEKRALVREAQERFGLSPRDVNSPASSHILRAAALPELWEKKWIVLRLESTLLLSYFTHDGYYYDFRNLGYVTDPKVAHISPTHEFMTKGVASIPPILAQLSRQMFIPVWGRVFTFSIFILSIFGFFLISHRIRYLFAAAIVLSALTSTAIGFGVDARMRVPMEPLIFIFAAVTIVRIAQYLKSRYAH